MEWTLPGTVLSVDADRPQAAEEVFSSLFLAGGLVLSQVTQVTGLEPYIIQNWVRRGFLAPPKQRKYTRRQLSRILMINALKSTLSIEQICKLLSYINGALDDEGDDTIDDTELYGAFVLMCVFPPLSILGIVFSTLGLSQIKKSFQRGKGLAVAGLTIGMITTVFSIFLYAMVFIESLW